MGKGGMRGGFGGSRSGGSGGGAGNMQQMLKQAQRMQVEMEKDQAELENITAEGTSGGGAVSVIVEGGKKVKEIKIKPEVVDPEDVEMLEDLIVAAVNDAMTAFAKISEEKMNKYSTAGIPGL